MLYILMTQRYSDVGEDSEHYELSEGETEMGQTEEEEEIVQEEEVTVQEEKATVQNEANTVPQIPFTQAPPTFIEPQNQ